MRKTEFANGEYYHIYNRGVDKREVFLSEKDYIRFLETIRFVNNQKTHFGLSDYKKRNNIRPLGSELSDPKGQVGQTNNLVDLVCYCLNPNHFHFILKQKAENGISFFMGKLGNSYTKYFNIKNSRSGSLFQGPFKSIHIDSNEYLLLLSAYVNANHEIHGFLEKDWPYSSFLDYTGKRDGKLCNKEIILGQFDNDFSEYEKYIKDNADYFREKKELEEYILE
ncbi:MAG: hypothetical protein US30_C0015G0009 [Candidatus Moranbacteria bacterium GW2011_GWF2_36_839]|nr:MAG: hypothetical protein US27_C0016G0011 [Candidatus Moranbacteria bacterium GW2011_GWF1_36_78]KKQ16530.1 MAG: hypothetical protein US30_C0015G0009 [Candidatus Moranbacteria bacterium GW2011_GWF2_36_839]